MDKTDFEVNDFHLDLTGIKKFKDEEDKNQNYEFNKKSKDMLEVIPKSKYQNKMVENY